MGSALSTFNDFMTATDKSIYTSPADVVNEAVKQNYLLRRFLKGKEGSSVMQGGKTINDMILFDEASTFDYYQPNETFTWQNPQVLDQWEINWRYCVDHMSWTDQEIELNVGGGLGKAARHRAYKNLRRIKEMRLYTSLLNGMEAMLFAPPSQSEMEAAGGKKPSSLPCVSNEGRRWRCHHFGRRAPVLCFRHDVPQVEVPSSAHPAGVFRERQPVPSIHCVQPRWHHAVHDGA